MSAQWTSATKYFTLTNHIYQPAAIVFNKAWFDTLSAADQQALLAVRTNGLVTRMRREIRALNPLLIQNLDDIGIQVYRPTAAELAAFHGPAQTARKTYLASASAGEKALAAQIDTALAAYRAEALEEVLIGVRRMELHEANALIAREMRGDLAGEVRLAGSGRTVEYELTLLVQEFNEFVQPRSANE